MTGNEIALLLFVFSCAGTSVMQVSAVDADDPMTDNAALSYSVTGQETVPPNSINKTMFGINNKTGVIYTRDVGLDRDVSLYFSLKHNLQTEMLI